MVIIAVIVEVKFRHNQHRGSSNSAGSRNYYIKGCSYEKVTTDAG